MKKVIFTILFGISFVGIISWILYTSQIIQPQPNLKEVYRIRCALHQEDCNIKVEDLMAVHEPFLEWLLHGIHNSSHINIMKLDIIEAAKYQLYIEGQYGYNYPWRFLWNGVWISLFILAFIFFQPKIITNKSDDTFYESHSYINNIFQETMASKTIGMALLGVLILALCLISIPVLLQIYTP